MLRHDALGWTFVRHQLGAFAATVIDYGVMIACVELARLPAPAAAGIGALTGAVTNFILARHWIFAARSASIVGQAGRYALASTASAAWNALGEYLVHDVAHLQYVLARGVVSIAVGVLWNFPLHRRFVFPRESGKEPG